MQDLTTRQFEVMRFIVQYRQAHPCSPTWGEIAAEISREPRTAGVHIAWLRRKGWLEDETYGKRNCRPTEAAITYFDGDGSCASVA